jgi:glycerol-3-phosphate cytidylyltransferase
MLYTRIYITFGTFDLFHIGHLNLLQNIKKLDPSGKLVVGVSSERLNREKKGNYPHILLKQRMAIVASIKGVDEVFVEESLEDKLRYCQEHKADVLVMGDDHQGKFDSLAEDGIEVIYLPRTELISTTYLAKSIQCPFSLQHNKHLSLIEEHISLVKSEKTRLMREVSSWLHKCGVRFVLGHGNLIEQRRGCTIDHDDDIDVRICYADREKLCDPPHSLLVKGWENMTKCGLQVWLSQPDPFCELLDLDIHLDLCPAHLPDRTNPNYFREYDIDWDTVREVLYLGSVAYIPNEWDTYKVLDGQYGEGWIRPAGKPRKPA